MEEFQHLNVQLLLNYFMLPYMHKCLLFGLIDSGQTVSNLL